MKIKLLILSFLICGLTKAQIVANFNVADACLGLPSCFQDKSTSSIYSIKSWNWNFGDGGTDSVQNPCHTYSTDGIYSVNLTVTNNNGEKHSISKSCVVNPLPVVTIHATKTRFNFGDSSVLTANNHMRAYHWTLNGEIISDKQAVTARKKGWYKIRITSPMVGCENEDSIFIDVLQSGSVALITKNIFSINVYPNPNNGLFELVINSETQGSLKLTVLDHLGRMVYKSVAEIKGFKHVPVDIDYLSNGQYILKIEIGGIVQSRRIVISM